MNKNNQRILAIDPGTTFMGIAVLDGGRLIYYGVKIIKKGNCQNDNIQSARNIIFRLIKDFKPHTVAVEKAFYSKSRNFSLLNVIVNEIKDIVRRKGIKLTAFSPCTVKKFITGNGLSDKYEVAQVVARQFPELRVYLTQDRAWKERFHQNMFDAVALGMIVQEV